LAIFICILKKLKLGMDAGISNDREGFFMAPLDIHALFFEEVQNE